ncbi:MAG: hypothetical protein KC546_05045 [Anaerolineae bacterium]|nr:hypothetical protein [Anaerolineae bacterium]
MDLILDWIAREGYIFVSWWLMIAIAGWTVMPLAWRLLGGLPDRGYTLAKPLGLLLIGFVYWLLVSLGLLGNTTGGILVAWLIVLTLAFIALNRLRGNAISWSAYWRENRTVIIVSELLFAVLFFTWLLYRAHNPDTYTTEKPMELAFISSIMRSDTFPPNDPWLSGYAISYYYFGYVIAAMLSMLSGVTSSIGFSAMFSALFALAGTTAFGVGYNLVRARGIAQSAAEVAIDAAKRIQPRFVPLSAGMLALFLVVLMGNFQTLLIELPMQSNIVTEDYLNFWGQPRASFERLDDRMYAYDPDASLRFEPATWGYWWWFGASRVLGDYNLDGTNSGEPISEFPAFSFVLGDTHPHVLALPFVIMTIGLMLNLLLTWRAPNRYEIGLYGLIIGGLIFMNAWDGPIYLAGIIGAEALRRVMRGNGRLRIGDWWSLFMLGLGLLFIAIIAYLPFFIGFRSQASGFLPNIIQPTYFPRLFLMMGPLLLLSGAFVAVELWRGRRRMNWSLGLTIGLGLLALLISVMLLLIFLSSFNAGLYARVQGFVDMNGGWAQVLPQVLQRRFAHGLTSVVLLTIMIIVIARLFPRILGISETDDDDQVVTYAPSTGFALLLVGIGTTLLFVPDFLYIADNFGWRINTIFKFYYQAWVTLSIAGAYATYTILADARLARPAMPLRLAFGAMLVVIIAAGSIYPLAATYSRAYVERGAPSVLSIDGGDLSLSSNMIEMVHCVDRVVGDTENVVIAEASLHSYKSNYARVGTITGLPILLGWPGHEGQWRGPTFGETAGSRQADLQILYTAPIWDIAQQIIDKYGIDYVVIGSTERQTYETSSDGVHIPIAEDIFAANGTLVCEYGEERVYHVTSTSGD